MAKSQKAAQAALSMVSKGKAHAHRHLSAMISPLVFSRVKKPCLPGTMAREGYLAHCAAGTTVSFANSVANNCILFYNGFPGRDVVDGDNVPFPTMVTLTGMSTDIVQKTATAIQWKTPAIEAIEAASDDVAYKTNSSGYSIGYAGSLMERSGVAYTAIASSPAACRELEDFLSAIKYDATSLTFADALTAFRGMRHVTIHRFTTGDDPEVIVHPVRLNWSNYFHGMFDMVQLNEEQRGVRLGKYDLGPSSGVGLRAVAPISVTFIVGSASSNVQFQIDAASEFEMHVPSRLLHFSAPARSEEGVQSLVEGLSQGITQSLIDRNVRPHRTKLATHLGNVFGREVVKVAKNPKVQKGALTALAGLFL